MDCISDNYRRSFYKFFMMQNYEGHAIIRLQKTPSQALYGKV